MEFNFPQAFAINVLAWGMIEFENGYRQAREYENSLRIVKWGLDYLIKCHPSENLFYAQVGEGHTDHAWWGRPEEMQMSRPSFKDKIKKYSLKFYVYDIKI